MRREGNLVSRPYGDLLAGVVSTGADVDQVDADFLQLLRKDRRLLETPTRIANQPQEQNHKKKETPPEPPLAMPLVVLIMRIVAPLLALEPICRADTVKDRLVPCGARRAGDLEREAESIGEGAAVGVGAVVGERGDVVCGGLAVDKIGKKGRTVEEVAL